MNEETKMAVPYIAHEAALARMERINKRLWILAVILVLLLFGSNAGWFWYEAQFTDEVTETYSSEVDGDGGLAIVNRDGSVNYGSTSDLYTDEEANP